MYPARTGARSTALRADPGRAWPLILAPLAMIVAIPVADAFLPAAVHFASLLPVAPAFTAAFAGPRLTAVVCGLTIAAQVLAGAERDDLGTEQVLLEVGALAILSVLLVLFCARRDLHEARFNRVQMIAETTQRAVLRPLPERSGPLALATEYRPAGPEGPESVSNRIGGDLLALTRTAHSTRLLLGDVRGHGLDAINDMAIVLGAFRAAAHREPELPELLSALEGSMHWGLAELSGGEPDEGERFVTAVVADIPDHEPVVHLISCGHPPPLMVHGTTVTPLAVTRPAPPLGLGNLSGAAGASGLFDASGTGEAAGPDDVSGTSGESGASGTSGAAGGAYTPQTFAFPPGGHLLLYTDGVSEARNREGDFYPLKDRAAGAASRTPAPACPAAFLARLTDDLLAYAGGDLEDDMAMIAVQRGWGQWKGGKGDSGASLWS